MTEKTNTTQNPQTVTNAAAAPWSQVGQDLRNSVLIVSVVANLFVFSVWIALQVTTQFDAQLATLLFNR